MLAFECNNLLWHSSGEEVNSNIRVLFWYRVNVSVVGQIVGHQSEWVQAGEGTGCPTTNIRPCMTKQVAREEALQAGRAVESGLARRCVVEAATPLCWGVWRTMWHPPWFIHVAWSRASWQHGTRQLLWMMSDQEAVIFDVMGGTSYLGG